MSAPTEAITILASSIRRPSPVFSICIPQFNRTSFLIEACRSLAGQSFSSFEICISDDGSTDGREAELILWLENSGLDFTYARQIANRRYDGNLRSAIALARGEFVFLMGNDDRLEERETLGLIHRRIVEAAPVQVAIVNYRELGTGRTFNRMPAGKLGSGPAVAARVFRDFSFVSGVIFNAAEARHWATTKWDGSEMYQMYLGCRIIASGGTLLGIGEVCIAKDIQIDSESVDSYAARKILKKDFSPVLLPMSRIAPLVTDAIAPYMDARSLAKTSTRIGAQLLMYTYAFWLVELRRVQSWKYAASVYRGLRPRQILSGSTVRWTGKTLIVMLYSLVGLGGLAMPVSLFQRLQPFFYRLAKSRTAAA